MSSVIEKEKTNKQTKSDSITPLLKPQDKTSSSDFAQDLDLPGLCQPPRPPGHSLLCSLWPKWCWLFKAWLTPPFLLLRAMAHAVLCAWNTMPFLGTLRNMLAKSSRHHRLGVGWSGIPINVFKTQQTFIGYRGWVRLCQLQGERMDWTLGTWQGGSVVIYYATDCCWFLFSSE